MISDLLVERPSSRLDRLLATVPKLSNVGLEDISKGSEELVTEWLLIRSRIYYSYSSIGSSSKSSRYLPSSFLRKISNEYYRLYYRLGVTYTFYSTSAVTR